MTKPKPIYIQFNPRQMAGDFRKVIRTMLIREFPEYKIEEIDCLARICTEEFHRLVVEESTV